MTIFRAQIDFGDLAFDPFDPARFGMAAQEFRIEAGIEVIRVPERVEHRRRVGGGALKPTLQRRYRVQREVSKRNRIAERAGAEPLLVEGSDAEVVAEPAERMEVAVIWPQPVDEFDAQLERAFGDRPVEAVLLVLSARERIGAGDRFVARRVFELGVPVVIALNKVDRLKGGHIATQMETASKLGAFEALHPVSAKTGDGVGELRAELVALLPEGPLYYPLEQRSDLPLELQIAELVREQALRLTKDEVPHAITVEVEEIDERAVRANVLVETESQKQIVVGKGGTKIRDIGKGARPEIEQLLGHAVYLELHVKVRPRWRRDEGLLQRLGI